MVRMVNPGTEIRALGERGVGAMHGFLAGHRPSSEPLAGIALGLGGGHIACRALWRDGPTIGGLKLRQHDSDYIEFVLSD